MSDPTNAFEIMKKLDCVNQSNQWIFYDDRFQEFFDFFAQNITEANILSEQKALQYADMGEVPKSNTLDRSQKLEKLAPGILECTNTDLVNLSKEIQTYTEAEQDYVELLDIARIGKAEANSRIVELEHQYNVLTTKETELYRLCQSEAKKLEILQAENNTLCKENQSCFKKNLSPPLLFHQLPLDQYLLKCESFMQNFTVYLKDNYKMQEYTDLDNEHDENEELISKLKNLRNSIEYYTLKYLEESGKGKATQAMTEEQDLDCVHVFNLSDMEPETHELKLLTQHHLKMANETLQNQLKAVVHQHAHQRIELVLFENTKHKLERAQKRNEIDKGLTKIIADALSNAELIWIAIQLDLERSNNRIDYSQQLVTKTQACQRRIKAMQNAAVDNSSTEFLESMANLLMHSAGAQRIRIEVKSCLYEWEKFCRLSMHSLQNMLSGRAYQGAEELLQKFKNVAHILAPIVYDSPIKRPLMYNVDLLLPIFNVKTNLVNIEKTLRSLRLQYQSNIMERMDKEPLWRAKQMLWIWFLKRPKRLIMAIEEVKRAAAAGSTDVRSRSGLKRK